jgi:hypothetical protein
MHTSRPANTQQKTQDRMYIADAFSRGIFVARQTGWGERRSGWSLRPRLAASILFVGAQVLPCPAAFACTRPRYHLIVH